MWLKQSTAVTLKIGPFLDDSDGKTAETGLTISQADIRLSKNGGAFAQTNNATGATHDENGWYGVPLDTTDTNTLGTLVVAVAESGALPVWAEFMVVSANVWDSLFGSDKLQVHAAEITAGLITATAIATGAVDADAIADNAIDAGAIAADAIGNSELAASAVDKIVDQNWDEATAGHAVAGSFGEQVKDTIDAILDDTGNAGVVLADGAITAAKIATDAIGSDELAASALAEINAEVDTALADIDLDHLIQVSAGAEEPTDGSYLDQIMHKDASQTFDATTDSLEAIRDTAPLGTAMRGTDSAALASVCTEARLAELGAANLPADVDAILADTGTDGVVISAAEKTAIADALLKRGVANVEATADVDSLTALVLAGLHSSISGTTWTIKRTDDATTFDTKDLTTDSGADPVTAVADP